ncbi:AbrB family transcriptional regulator [Georgenia subflava]|uniref:AbrB family transcriptional regulator n=1 Tax=Georgenia subflava TaxID=1622177 RepID=UPI00186B164A|nr:AbrB family transcriptional regulator [Georgenia subflava]
MTSGAEGPGRGGRARRVAGVVRVLVGASAGAALLSVLGVPAGVLLGSVLGAALANRAVPGLSVVQMPRGVRVVGFVLLGCVTGVQLEPAALATLGHVIGPLLGAVAVLLCLNIVLALVLVRRYDVDPMTAVLATAPGGVSEIVGVAMDRGARISLVLAVHSVRVLVIVLIALPLLLAYLSASS